MKDTESVRLLSSDGFLLRSSEGSYLNASLEDVLSNVEKVSEIPDDAKRAVKDFIEHHFKELCERVFDLDNLELPVELINKFPEFIEYLKLAFGTFI